ncbi:hypothetical protein SAMN05216338_1003216 [Bradyrhizobium sp. Rc2d]|uniref:hypothetical protein n=1 Tax=Bradyrhizobium sp. Rc2d TaxID=1855321 RepID=UPI000886A367|nr:hypothetical protein [Bradyrhizobium sp. Rc2d]SDG85554.1 hypothetical protein SAMN05216338_1003216 [Bradyrhizobium sp. Rc2d]
MTRLPPNPVEPGTSFQEPNVDHHASAITPVNSRAKSIGIDRTRGNDDKSHTSISRHSDVLDRLDATIESALELSSIDAVSRINFDEARAPPGQIEPGSELAWLNEPNLAHSLLSFVTPRLRHSHVLRPEQHGLLLERLADTLSAAPEDLVPREGAALLQLELQRLILLRQSHNGLIKG